MEYTKHSPETDVVKDTHPTPEQISLPVGVEIPGTLLPREKSEFELSAERHNKISIPASEIQPQKCTFMIEEQTSRSSPDSNILAAKIIVEAKNINFKKDNKIILNTTHEGKTIEVVGKVVDVFPMRVTGEKTRNETWINIILNKVTQI
jgi:hypothetical protein